MHVVFSPRILTRMADDTTAPRGGVVSHARQH